MREIIANIIYRIKYSIETQSSMLKHPHHLNTMEIKMKQLTSAILTSLFIIISLPTQADEITPPSKLTKQQYFKKVLLVVAMKQEAEPIINALHLKETGHSYSGLPMRSYVGKYAHKDVFLIMNGTDPINKVENIGTQPATLSAYLGIENFHPDLVISIGTAGGIAEKGTKIDDILISEKIYFFSRRSPQTGYTEYGMGGYPSYSFDDISHKMKLKKSIICSGDSFHLNATDKRIVLKNKCSAIEMEAAGVAWVSMLTKIPMVAIKGIDDQVDVDSEEQYAKNSSRLQHKLGQVIKSFLSFLPDDTTA